MDILKIRKKAQEVKESLREKASGSSKADTARHSNDDVISAANAADDDSASARPKNRTRAKKPKAAASTGSSSSDTMSKETPSSETTLHDSVDDDDAGLTVTAPKTVGAPLTSSRAAKNEVVPDHAREAALSSGRLSATSTNEPSTSSSGQAASVRALDPLGELLARYDDEEGDESGDADVTVRADVRRYLGFDLGEESYAADILEIREIVKMVAVTPVPRAPDEVLGVFSKRGIVMPVIDLAAALGLREPVRTVEPEHRVLVVGEGDDVIGLRVDAVYGVFQIASDAIGAVPGGLEPNIAAMLTGLARVNEGLFILIDMEAFRESLGVVSSPVDDAPRGRMGIL